MNNVKTYTALGLMSGTSLDGIDAAIIETDGHSILSFGPFESKAYGSAFRNRLRAALGSRDKAVDLEEDLTRLHSELINEMLSKHNLDKSRIDVIGFHGQTTLHEPENHLTLQLGDGQLLAQLTELPVVNNFRAADVAAGGEGAPFAPVYHQALAVELDLPVAVVNIGGVANVSYIDNDHLLAFDTGPGNAPIDDLVLGRLQKKFDKGGQLAKAGMVDETIAANFICHPFFDQKPPKSLDRNAFDFTDIDLLATEDAAATLVRIIADTIGQAPLHFPNPVNQWLVSGGGRHNPMILAELATRLDGPVKPVESVGWNGDAIEAQAFAFMAVRSLLDLPLSFPTTTGVSAPQRGGQLNRP